MTSFGYRLNPRYAIKECSSYGTLYTRDCCCSKGNVEDKILVSKPPKKCTRCGHSVDGPYQGCALLRKKLKEDLGIHSQDFQNTFESSYDSTNIVNAPREPFVVKQDHRSFVDKIICDLNKALDSTHLHTFSPNQFHCFHCKDVLGDGEACQRCTCTRCGSGLSKGLCYIYRNNQNSLNDSPSLLLAWDRVFKIKDAFGNEQYKPENIQELFYKLLDDLQNIHKELAEYINTLGWNCPTFYNNGDDDDVNYTIAITPVLSTEEPHNSLSIPDTMCDVHLVNNHTPLETKDNFEIVMNSNDDYSSSNDDPLYYENFEYVEASPYDSELVSLEVEKIIIPEDEEIEDDNLRKKLFKVNLLIDEIEALKDNPTPSSEFLTKSSSTSPKPFLKETDTFDNSLPEFENFFFDLEEISSFPPTDRSDFTHEEFADELAHIISPLEYDCFYFGNFPDLGEWISNLNSEIHENLSSTTRMNLPVEDDHSPLLTYVVWIFLAYLTYPVIPPHLYSFGNEDTMFDPGITINRFYSFKLGLSYWCGTFKKFNTHRSHLNESPMEMLFSTFFPMDQ
nr:hypothetical protein [Tanacetum cinerariifolium]